MPKLQEIDRHIQDLLRIREVPDYPQALSGIQLENRGAVTRIAAAVDACLPVIEEAVARKADLLLVHHGLFWQGLQPIEGAFYRKLRAAMEGGLAIYSVHIPLDVHEDLGNNARLAAAMGLDAPGEPFLPWKGILLGRRFETNMNRDELLKRLAQATGAQAHLCPGGPETVRSVGIVTGGAGSEVAAAAREVDTFITGEGQHWTWTLAEELGMNLIYGGHYATETFGVKALAAHLSERFELPWEFIDHPTGL